MSQTITQNEEYEEIEEEVMSNFDHTIDEKVADKLKEGKYYSQYTGWNFCGYIYWNNDNWICEIWQYNSKIDTKKASTLSEIMDEVSSQYGNE